MHIRRGNCRGGKRSLCKCRTCAEPLCMCVTCAVTFEQWQEMHMRRIAIHVHHFRSDLWTVTSNAHVHNLYACASLAWWLLNSDRWRTCAESLRMCITCMMTFEQWQVTCMCRTSTHVCHLHGDFSTVTRDAYVQNLYAFASFAWWPLTLPATTSVHAHHFCVVTFYPACNHIYACVVV